MSRLTSNQPSIQLILMYKMPTEKVEIPQLLSAGKDVYMKILLKVRVHHVGLSLLHKLFMSINFKNPLL